MSQVVLHAEAADEAAYEQCLAEIATRGRLAARREGELATLRQALGRFEAICQARVGDLLRELQRIRLAMADYEHRLAALDPRRVAEEPAEPESDGWWDDPELADALSDPDDDDRPLAERAVELKRLYRSLAKRCHPDRAESDTDRRRRETLMQRINAAYRGRDLDGLRELSHQTESDDPAFAARPVADRLAWARRELARLERRLHGVSAEITTLRRSEVYRRWRRHEAGEAVVDALENDLQVTVATEASRLDLLVATYRLAFDDERRPLGAAV